MEFELDAKLPYDEKPASRTLKVNQVADSRLSRHYWIITTVRGGGYFDVRKETALIYNFDSATGTSNNGSETNTDVTSYTYVLCILPGATYLSEGDVVKLGFYYNNVNRPYIKQIIKSKKGREAMSPSFLVPGIWDQTWRSFYQDARSVSSSIPSSISYSEAWTYETDAPDGWQPDGLLFQKTGRVLHVSRFREGPGSGQHELHVRLLNTNTLPYTEEISFSLELVNEERTADWLYPDGTSFYNTDDDILTIAIAPSRDSWGSNNARLLSLKPNTTFTSFSHAISEFSLSEEPKRSWSVLGHAGNNMVRFDFPRNQIEQFSLNTDTLQWQSTGLGNLFSGDFGLHYTGPGAATDLTPRRNYSPAYTKGIFYCLGVVRELVEDVFGANGTNYVYNPETNIFNLVYVAGEDWQNYRLREVSVDTVTGAISEIDLIQLNTITRSSPAPVELAICNSWAAGYRANTVDTRFPETGDYDEVGFAEYSASISNGYATGHPDYESATYEWTEFRTRRWLGCAFNDFEHSFTPEYSWGSNWPVILTPGYALANGGVPISPAGLPAPTPNRAWWGRAFWNGQTPSPREWAGYATRSDSRSIATQDGWRYHLALVPHEPVWTPNTLEGDLWVNDSHSTYEQDFNTYIEVPFTTVNPAVHENNPVRVVEFNTQRRQISYLTPAVRWTWKTVIISVSPEGDVYEREISDRWTNLQFPCELVGSEVVVREIEEELCVAENAYQLFTVPRHNLLGVVVDKRTSVMADPAPTILLLDITDRFGLAEKYRIDPSQIYESLSLVTSETDEEWDGPESTPQDPDYWIREGQFIHTLHGTDESGPQCKVIERATDTLLVVGTQAVQRVEPGGPSGTVINRTTLFRLNANDSDELASSYNDTGDDSTHGPRMVRTMAVSADRIVLATNRGGPRVEEIS